MFGRNGANRGNNQFAKEDSDNVGILNSNPHIIELLMAEIERVKKSSRTMLVLILLPAKICRMLMHVIW